MYYWLLCVEFQADEIIIAWNSVPKISIYPTAVVFIIFPSKSVNTYIQLLKIIRIRMVRYDISNIKKKPLHDGNLRFHLLFFELHL